MSNLPGDIRAAIAPKGRTLLVTVGSSLRADDGVGPFIGESLRVSGDALKVINAYTTPENIAQAAIAWKPDKIVVVDAARFGGKPGEFRIIPLDRVNQQTVMSTHSFPLSVTFSIIKEDTGAELVVLGIEPGSMDFAEGLTPEVKDSALNLVEFFNNIVQGRGP